MKIYSKLRKPALEETKNSYLCAMNQKRIAIFASGNGSNAMNIIKHFENHPMIEIAFVLANSPQAKVLQLAKEKGVKTILCTNEEAASEVYMVSICKNHHIDFIILAGFLRKIPSTLIQAFPEKIINIHPSLLPKFGGKGMYGMYVHEAVLLSGEKETGITIHFVNEEFDKGKIIAQFSVALNQDETPSSIQLKVQQLEHTYFASTIEKTIML